MMGLTALSLFNEPRNTRELILLIIADDRSLTLRRVQSAIKRFGVFVSLQAIQKHMKALIEDGQVIRDGNSGYSINPAWIRALRVFCDIMERAILAETDEY